MLNKHGLLLKEILCNANNVIFSEAYFQWGIISEDLDDNKFSDLAISTNSDCLVTFDKHFNVFKNESCYFGFFIIVLS